LPDVLASACWGGRYAAVVACGAALDIVDNDMARAMLPKYL
jgi:hypothetical protein